MIEQAPNSVGKNEALLQSGEIEKLLEAHTHVTPEELAAEKTLQLQAAETARTAAESIDRENPLHKLEASEAENSKQTPIAPPNKHLKQQTLKNELKNIQRKESVPARTLSRVVHQPVVRAASEVAGKSISRPSGLLGGGVLAFTGSSTYLYLAYHIGFVYQPTVFILLFIAGFLLGLGLELLIRLLTRAKPNA